LKGRPTRMALSFHHYHGCLHFVFAAPRAWQLERDAVPRFRDYERVRGWKLLQVLERVARDRPELLGQMYAVFVSPDGRLAAPVVMLAALKTAVGTGEGRAAMFVHVGMHPACLGRESAGQPVKMPT
jgi:hypothetical protein